MQQTGVFGPVIMFIMFFIQAVAPVIPYGVLAIAAGAVYGSAAGFLLAWIGAVLGTLSIYLFSCYYGRDYFRRKIEGKYSFSLESMNALSVFGLLLLFRILPIVPLPVVNIYSGISGVPWRTFIGTAALGTIPWAFAYTFLGNYASMSNDITNTLKYVVLILFIIFTGAYTVSRRIPIGKRKNR